MDLFDYMATLRRMKAYGPTRMYPGHGPCIGEAGDGGYVSRGDTVIWTEMTAMAAKLVCKSLRNDSQWKSMTV